MLAQLHQVGTVAAFPASNDNGKISFLVKQMPYGSLVVIGGITKCIPCVCEIISDVIVCAMFFDHHLFEVVGYGLCIGGQHGRLVHDTKTQQVFFKLKSFAVAAFEEIGKTSCIPFSCDEFPQDNGLFHVIDDQGWCMCITV